MSLVIRNLQRVIPIRRAPLRSKIEIVRRILGVQEFDLGIVCVDNKTIQHINRIYRDRNVPTDVLSFPFHENLKAGEFPQPDSPDDYNLGDIFLGVEYIFQQCKENEDYNDILMFAENDGFQVHPCPYEGHELIVFDCCIIFHGDCHPWTVSLAGLHTSHRGRVAADVPEGEGGAGRAGPTHWDPPAAVDQGPLLRELRAAFLPRAGAGGGRRRRQPGSPQPGSSQINNE
uniref:endoribonuclease YbeY isoform X1 n=1 Tax=Callithrix jacchus TaxID=9483 RepID=UPI0023DCFE3D|nr:endoribonuclease YbeY isoform X1 [Callithrix jacchus]XP_054105096.1 endoribonuclease YbeY isoform X1 [Callithrix jacchus]